MKTHKCRRAMGDLSGYRTQQNADSGIDEERDQIAESSRNPKKVTKLRARDKY
jgi:hypothetical protein